MISEAEVQCPYCWETVSLEVDASGGDASYTEDCPVCCQPMLVTVRLDAQGDCTVEVVQENG